MKFLVQKIYRLFRMLSYVMVLVYRIKLRSELLWKDLNRIISLRTQYTEEETLFWMDPHLRENRVPELKNYEKIASFCRLQKIQENLHNYVN